MTIKRSEFDGDGIAEMLVTSPWGIGILKLSGNTLTAPMMAPNGTRFGGWLLNTVDNRFDQIADFDGDGKSELLVTSPWGIGILKFSGNTLTASMMAPNGTRFGGWLLSTTDNRFGPLGDFDGDGKVEILVSSPWGIGIFKLSGNTFNVMMMAENGTRFGGWLLNTADNRFSPVGDVDGDGKDEIVITSLWGIGILKLSGNTLIAPMMAPNGTRFGGWLLNTVDNHVVTLADLDNDGKDEIVITSPWGIGILKLSGNTLIAPMMAPNGTRFGGWLLNTLDNRVGPAADFDGDGKTELFISSPWGIGVFKLAGNTFNVPMMAPNGTRFGGWLLNTADNHFDNTADFTGEGKIDILVTSPWGIGILRFAGNTFNVLMMAPNGTRFGGWLLNTGDNRFKLDEQTLRAHGKIQPPPTQRLRTFSRVEAPYPICPAAEPNDTLMFEGGKDASRKFYLPRYRLREISGRYEVAVNQDANGLWSLRFGVEAYAAPEITDPTAQILPHSLSAEVRYTAANTNIRRQLPIAAMLPDTKGYDIGLRLTLEERDGLLRAFRSDEAQAQLIITRLFNIAIPIDHPDHPAGAKPEFRIRNLPARHTAPVMTMRMQPAAVERQVKLELMKRPREPIDPGIDEEPIGPRPKPRLQVPPLTPPPVPPIPQTPQEPQFLAASRALDSVIMLRFDQADHPYIFPAGAGTQVGVEIERITLAYPEGDANARRYPYFRDVSHPNRFYYLPDAFKLGRRMELPFVPGLAIQVDQGEQAEEAAFMITCFVRPYVNGRRLLAAKAALKAHIPVASGVTGTEVELQPLLVVRDKTRLRLGLPRSGGAMTDISADVDLANGFLFSERFSFPDFQDIFAALNSPTISTLFHGAVAVTTGLANEELIPTYIRFQDMEGEVFDFTEQTDAATGIVTATLRNATESPLRISDLPVWLARSGTQVAGRIEGLDLSAPIHLVPDAAVTFRIHPVTSLPGEGSIDAIFDSAQVTGLPDAEKILKVVLDPTVDQESERQVTVITSADVLTPEGQPDKAIRLIIIEFRGNRVIRLDANHLEAIVDVPVPLVDILLRSDTEGFYEFRQTIVYQSNQQVADTQWRRSDAGLLFLPLG